MRKINTLNDLHEISELLTGKSFAEIDKKNTDPNKKGYFGNVVQESGFGLPKDNAAEADFSFLGVELKVTPYKQNKNESYSAKERLVANIIDYMSEFTADKFEESSFYKKCQSMLLMFYKSVSDLGKSEYKISHFKFTTLNQETNEENEFFFVLPEEDIEIMRQDWQTIIDKIKDGRAHEISESDTNYLSACTKGSSSKTVRKQPFSETHAKQRAFSLKTTYMTHFINNYIMKRGQSERLIKDVEELKNKKFEQIIMDKFAPYYGMTIEELALSFNLGISNKSINNRIVAAILDIKGNINESDEFQKASIISKTIRIETSGKIKESMSFPAIDFERLIEDEWEDSEFYSQIGLSRFMFTIFVSDGEQYRLKETIFWNMPEDDLEQAKEVWELTKDMVKNNRLDIGGKHGFSVTNFPKSSDNNVSHVRPHDKDMKMGRIELWGGKKIAKYGFWLNCKYICKILGEKNVIHKS